MIINYRPHETEDYKPGDDGKFPDGKFYPETMLIGPEALSVTPTYDQRQLVIRLERNYYDYGRLEELVGLGVKFKRNRAEEIKAYYEQAKAGKIDPSPLQESDLWAAYLSAKTSADNAENDWNEMKRPPREY